MPLPRDRKSVGEEYRDAQRELLRDIAWEALRLHRLMDRGQFGTSDDVRYFTYDCERLRDAAAELETNSRNARAYFAEREGK